MTSWRIIAEDLKFEKNKSWTETAKEIKEKFFPELDTNIVYDKVRSVLRRSEKYKSNQFREVTKKVNILETVHCSLNSNDNVQDLKLEKPSKIEIMQNFEPTEILKPLKNGCTIEQLSIKFSVLPHEIIFAIDKLKSDGYDIVCNDEFYTINKTAGKEENVFAEDWRGDGIIRFGIIGDTHLCSKAQQLTHLNTYYDICQCEGIKTIYHCGDIVDGDDVYKGHRFETICIGGDAQKKYAVENYPKRAEIITKFIGGNHDLKWFEKDGFDVCAAIANERADLIYLGQYIATVNLTSNCRLRLDHPMGAGAYSLSYKTQRKIDNMKGGSKPHILAQGHWHQSGYFFRRNVHGILTPSFQGPTTLSDRLGLEQDNGGWIFEIHVDEEGTINDFNPHFIPFLKTIEHDY